jgi:CheY-like chemotaxis protein
VRVAGELILIVEDNSKNLKLVRDLLQLNGYRALGAETAEAGLALASARAPHLILMDIQLPDLDGIEALHRLRDSPRTAKIPVVALTAFAMKEDRQRFMSEGFDDYLAKPIDIRAFPAQVRTLLARNLRQAAERGPDS